MLMLLRILSLLVLAVTFVSAGSYDCVSFVKEALAKDPIVTESRYSTTLKKSQLDALKAEVILPTFSFSMMVGPAPGLKEYVDGTGDTIEAWNFAKMGPFWGTQIKAIQPLNLGQYNVGKKAIQADIRQHELGLLQGEHKKEVEFQSYYYNYLLALEMNRLAKEAKKQIDEAYDKLEEALDNDDPNVSQMDFLKLKANMYVVQEAVSDADRGLKQVLLAIRFSLNLNERDSFSSTDTILTVRTEPLLSLEEIKTMTLNSHPELKQLQAGLQAKSYQMDLAGSKLAPEFFIMAEFEYIKSWAGDRQVIQKNAFAQDAVNKLGGTFGIGLRYRLNFWKGMESFRKARIEYNSLRLKDRYALDGLLLKVEEQYYKLESLRDKLESIKTSLRATEAILKGAAIQYDLDPSNAEKLLSAYTQNINLKKNYYFAICSYNIEFAELIYRMGLSLEDFHTTYMLK